MLAAAKVLDDCNLPLFSKLVRAVYSDLFGGSEGEFRTAIQSLAERQWLTVVGEDLVATTTLYEIHDIQLTPVQANANDHIDVISTLLLEGIERTVPQPAQAVIHFISGYSFYDWGAYTKSREQWGAVLEIDPDDAVTHNNYATLLARQFDEPERAVDHYERAIEIEPEYAEAHNNYGHLLRYHLGQFEAAARHFDQAIDIDSEYAEAHNNYGLLLAEEFGRTETAVNHFERAIEIDPELADAHYNYANILFEGLDRLEAAAEHYERAMEINPEIAYFHSNYGNLLFKGFNRPEAAAEHYERAIDIDPEHADAHNNYAHLLKNERRELEKAANHLELAIDAGLDSDDQRMLRRAFQRIPAFVNLCEEVERQEAAITSCERALERISKASLPDVDRFEHQIRVMYAKITSRPAVERVPELYQFGLSALHSGAVVPSADLLREAWDLRDELDGKGRIMAVSAGVWCVGIPDFVMDKEAVKSTVKNLEESPSVIVNAVWTGYFTDEDPPNPSQLRQSYSIEDNILELELAAYENLYGIVSL